MSKIEREFIDAKEAAEFLGTTVCALENRRKRRVGPPWVRLGAQTVRYSVPQLRAWLESRAVVPSESGVRQEQPAVSHARLGRSSKATG